jgi:carboxyl-terminal processing protease
MFYRVSGGSNQAKGVNSDIVLPSFTEEMEVGEVFNENYLPWGTIQSARRTPQNYEGYVPLSDTVIRQLAGNSQRRFRESPQLKQFQQDILRFKEVRKRKQVSLNEKKRLQEYYDEKAAADRVEALLESSENKDNKDGGKDLLLIEAVTIAGEYAELQQKKSGK